MGKDGYDPADPFKVVCGESKLSEPLKVKKAARIGVSFMGDLFHDDVPDEFIAATWQVMADCPQHTFLVLTKRPSRMLDWLNKWWTPDKTHAVNRGGKTYHAPNLYCRQEGCNECANGFLGCLNGRTEWKDKSVRPNYRDAHHRDWWGNPESVCDAFEWRPRGDQHGVVVELDGGYISVRDEMCMGGFPGPLKNVHIGTSCSTQADVDANVPELLRCPAAVRWLSLEPMLETVDLGLFESMVVDYREPAFGGDGYSNHGKRDNAFGGVVVGCESGPGRRPCKTEWVESVVAQCVSAGVPVYVKQIDIEPVGAETCNRGDSHRRGTCDCIRGHVSTDMSEWPVTLFRQELPA